MKISPRFAASFLVLALTVGSVGRVLAGDADAFLGTWVLNPGSSTLPQGTPPVQVTLTVTDAGGGKYKSVTQTSVAGQEFKVEITFAIDGKDYSPVITPAPPGVPPTTQSYQKVSAKAYKSTIKVNGQLAATSTSEVSADGKVMTVKTSAAGGSGDALNTLVFDKK